MMPILSHKVTKSALLEPFLIAHAGIQMFVTEGLSQFESNCSIRQPELYWQNSISI